MNTNQEFVVNEEVRKKILHYLDIDGVSQEKQDEILAKIGEVALKEIFIAIIEQLNDEQKKEYNNLLEKESSFDEVENFLKKAIPNYDDITKSVIKNLIKDLRDTTKSVE